MVSRIVYVFHIHSLLSLPPSHYLYINTCSLSRVIYTILVNRIGKLVKLDRTVESAWGGNVYGGSGDIGDDIGDDRASDSGQ